MSNTGREPMSVAAASDNFFSDMVVIATLPLRCVLISLITSAVEREVNQRIVVAETASDSAYPTAR